MAKLKAKKGRIKKNKRRLSSSFRSNSEQESKKAAEANSMDAGAKAGASLNLSNSNKSMTTKEIIEKAKKELVNLTEFKSPNAIGVKKEGNEWVITIELIEKESIPDGMDILGTYAVRTDQSGGILDYKRTDLRKRVDTALNPET